MKDVRMMQKYPIIIIVLVTTVVKLVSTSAFDRRSRRVSNVDKPHRAHYKIII